MSDSICTGLQLANFCQDVARDWALGRVYLPQETLARAGYDEAMFARREFNDAFRQALREEVDRAERYLLAGRPLVDLMPRELRLDVALFVARRAGDPGGHSPGRLRRVARAGQRSRACASSGCWLGPGGAARARRRTEARR